MVNKMVVKMLEMLAQILVVHRVYLDLVMFALALLAYVVMYMVFVPMRCIEEI